MTTTENQTLHGAGELDTKQMDLDEALQFTRNLFDDLSYRYAYEWKAMNPARRIVGFLPIYVPREIVHALNMLPVGLFGAGDKIPVVRGDAYFQSYICHLPRTMIEMALNDSLRDFDAVLFPAICDVIRNLSGIFQLTTKDKLVRFLDFPQNFQTNVGGVFYRHELERLAADLGALNGRTLERDALNNSIRLYNQNRSLLQQLASFRSTSPHKLSAVDHYLILRAGQEMTVEHHNGLLERILTLLPDVDALEQDKIRVVVSGSFCEQPPLGLIRTVENAGCYIVDDDFQLGMKWTEGDIPCDSDDPVGALVESYLNNSTFSSAVYDGDNPKEIRLERQVRDHRADGVIFCAPSFCDPALLDRPILEKAMERRHIRHIGFQYHENLGQFHVVKEQAGTFADMIKLWD